jgi:hypothetical protein
MHADDLISYVCQANKYRDEAKRKEARTAAENIETPACEEFFNKYKFKANIF